MPAGIRNPISPGASHVRFFIPPRRRCLLMSLSPSLADAATIKDWSRERRMSQERNHSSPTLSRLSGLHPVAFSLQLSALTLLIEMATTKTITIQTLDYLFLPPLQPSLTMILSQRWSAQLDCYHRRRPLRACWRVQDLRPHRLAVSLFRAARCSRRC